jgi:DNA-binding MarR family transcriptional regulator
VEVRRKSVSRPQTHDRDVTRDLLRQWKRERPDLNATAMAIVGRILRIGKTLEQRANAVLQPFGLRYSELDVLATLRRMGKPYSLKPSQLQQSVLITSGAMTACLNRLERAALISRTAEQGDRRVLNARLTPTGLRLIDRAIAERFGEAQDAISALSSRERRQLAQLLTKLEVGLPSRVKKI